MLAKLLLSGFVLSFFLTCPGLGSASCLQAGFYQPSGGEMAAVLSFMDNGAGIARVEYSVSAFSWDCDNGRISFLDGPRAGEIQTANTLNSGQFAIGNTIYTRNPDVSFDTRYYQRPDFRGDLTIASYGGGIYSLELTTSSIFTGAVCSFRSNCERTGHGLICPDPASFGAYVYVSDPSADIVHVTSSGFFSACSRGGEFTGWYASQKHY